MGEYFNEVATAAFELLRHRFLLMAFMLIPLSLYSYFDKTTEALIKTLLLGDLQGAELFIFTMHFLHNFDVLQTTIYSFFFYKLKIFIKSRLHHLRSKYIFMNLNSNKSNVHLSIFH